MSKPRGYFKYILAMDCETTGIAFGSDDPSFNPKTEEEFQSVSWGFIVLEGETLKEVDRLYLEIKWDGISEWSEGAARVHGLTKAHLKENGLTAEEAVVEIANLIVKYWGTDSPICPLGHNVMFDVAFLKRLMRKYGVELKFGNRIVDSNSLGYILMNTYNSDDLFTETGQQEREDHNSLEDIEMTVEALRRLKMIFDIGLE